MLACQTELEAITLTMPGTFNVENALCAIACTVELGVPPEQIAEGLARTKVPGRMELIRTPNAKVTGIVDFAHNKMAFEKFFPSVVKDFPDHHLIAVFGATGDKATERRFELPAVAGKFADHLIFTKDDPGHEKPEDICRAMAEATPKGVPCEIVPDRAAAIARAVELGFAADGPAVICVLGRGTEGVQHECGKLIPAPLDADLFQDAVRDWCAKHPEDREARESPRSFLQGQQHARHGPTHQGAPPCRERTRSAVQGSRTREGI